MSLPLTVKAPVRAFPEGVDESWGVHRSAFHRSDQGDREVSFSLASRDVIDEVRHRMARRGFVWE